METFKVISFTHKNLPLELLGKLHLTPDEQTSILGALKLNFEFEEVLFLSTCNRIELLAITNDEPDALFIKELCLFINSRLGNTELELLSKSAEVFIGNDAVEHVLKVASSLESLVIGEREIITQVRKAYDFCNMLGLTRDFLRLLIKQTIETAKEVYTNTDIAKNPVSVMSLAYRQLRTLGIKTDARIVFVGSGETNTAMANYMQKHKFANFAVFNRTLSNAQKLATTLGGKAYELSALETYDRGFDVLIVCTAFNKSVITTELYNKINLGESTKKIVIDLSLPSNVDEAILSEHKKVTLININSLKEQAEANMELRKKEIVKCEQIIKTKTEQFNWLHKERRIELAFGEIPKQVKAIKELAVNEVFAKEVNMLDEQGKEVLDKVLAYVEKKYNAVAITTAKNVLLNNSRE